MAHTISAGDLADQLCVQPATGLALEETLRRKIQFGPNQLPNPPQRQAWQVFAAQFQSILILILAGASGLSALIGNLKDALVILAVMLINATVGFYQEWRAEQSLAALKEMLPSRARVRRQGEKLDILATDLVPGDVVFLEAGDLVPADGRLWFSVGLESALTGESQPAVKQTDGSYATETALADRRNMVYMNTLVTRGRAEIIVTSTGVHTEMGKLSLELAATTEVPTPLQIQLDGLGKRLGTIALLLVGMLALIEFIRGTDLAHIAIDAIALGVAAMPEGLPVVVTVTLALGMRNMARQHAIVKRLASVETLGCTTVICSDKTGTLTLNQMTVCEFWYQGQHFLVSGEGYGSTGEIRIATNTGSAGVALVTTDLEPLMTAIVSCNDSHIEDGKVIGDPMEAALLVLARKGRTMQGTDIKPAQPLTRSAEIPFDSAHKFMTTFHHDDAQKMVQLFIKGAPDVLLELCSSELGTNGAQPMSNAERQQFHDRYQMFGEKGLRGLLIASRTIKASEFDPTADLKHWMTDLTLIGLVGLIDPPRSEARVAIAQCAQAGIDVKMITGDHQITALAIARDLGLKGQTMTGSELDRVNPSDLPKVIKDKSVFARVTPSHKVIIVRALQKDGQVVAMTGDGVNDAPALKSADIGVAMGSGTSVAKAAATMVLTDDNFATLVSAVRQGRTLYDNIVKFVRFQLSTTIGAILTVLLAPLLGLADPFTAVQILWIAIIMDGPPAVSLALDAARPGIMHESPRSRDEPLLTRARIAKVAAYGVTMATGTLAVLYYTEQQGTTEQAQTLAFTTFVLFQFFNVFNARVESGTAFNKYFFNNKMLWSALTGALILQIIAVQWEPAHGVFGTQSLNLADWVLATLVASSILVLEESRKLIAHTFKKMGAGVKLPHWNNS